MKWIAIVIVGLVAVVVGIGSMLPRTHKASRTLRVKRSPADVWPVVMQVTQASDVPVDVLDSRPPNRLVTRVTEKEKNFGGTWTIDFAPVDGGSTVTVTEDGWVANPVFRFVSRLIIGHHATMDGMLKQVAKTLNEEAVLSGQ
jgi:hypothetical protein